MIYLKVVRILIIISLPGIEIFSQQGWFPINISTNWKTFNSVYFINDSVGYTVSDRGTVMASINFGESWEELKLTTKSLNDIYFADCTGFIVGEDGRIFKTTNGRDWVQKNSNSNQTLNAVYLIDADTGYAFGSGSTILKTTDAGESWIKIDLASNLNITDGAFSSPDFGLCTTSDGVLLRTQDYGSSWQYSSFSSDNPFYSVSFSDDSTAYITGWDYDVSLIIKLTDRATNIQYIYPGSMTHLYSSCFVNSNLGFITGDGGYLSKTTDGGNNWSAIFNQNRKKLNSIFFIDSVKGYAVGNDSTLIRTIDGGNNWSAFGSGFNSHLKAMHFPTEEVGFTVGGDGTVYKITNNKAALISITAIHNYLSFVYFIDTLKGFTGGSIGKFFTTTDGGLSWELTDFGPQNVISMRSIDFYQNRIGIISANSKLLKTTNGGGNWKVINSNTSSSDIAFINEQELISVGIGGKIYKSTDGGDNWRAIVSPTNYSLNSVDFIDENNGFAVGWNGAIVKTTDRGETWSNVSFTVLTFWKIKFISQNKGYIIGHNGVVYYSSNGGNNWKLQNPNTENNLNDIFFVNDTTGYIAGNDGTLLKTYNGGTVGINELYQVSRQFLLYQNYPNPFNPTTKIRFEIPKSSVVNLTIYDLLGREIIKLIDEEKPAGEYETTWNASSYPSGVYFLRIQAGQFSETRKLVLMK